MTDQQICRDLRLLKGYAAFLTVVLGLFAFFAFRGSAGRGRFTEIDAERVNIVEPDGHLRMVFSNRPRSPAPIYKGEPFGYPGGGRPGVIFFNDEGTENGGLTLEGKRNPDGTYTAGTHMSFDQFDQDQVLNLDYGDDNGVRRTGIAIDDRAQVDLHDMIIARDSIMKIADTSARARALEQWAAPRNGVPLAARRLFVGRDRDKAAVVSLFDPNGRPRLRMIVDSIGTPSIEFLDAGGKVTARFPGAR